jgi:Ca2+-binding EF-hand superfamily protein
MRNQVDAIWAAFAELSGCDGLDSDPGAVTVEGLQRACEKYDVKLSVDELHQLIDELDSDGDGSVDRNEFMRLMRLAPWF